MPTNLRQRAPVELGSDRKILAIFALFFAIIGFAVVELTFTKISSVAEEGGRISEDIASD